MPDAMLNTNRHDMKAPPEEAARAAVHYRMQAYELRDQLRREFIRCMEERRPFPSYAQHMLDRVETMIQAEERTAALRFRDLKYARPLRS